MTFDPLEKAGSKVTLQYNVNVTTCILIFVDCQEHSVARAVLMAYLDLVLFDEKQMPAVSLLFWMTSS